MFEPLSIRETIIIVFEKIKHNFKILSNLMKIFHILIITIDLKLKLKKHIKKNTVHIKSETIRALQNIVASAVDSITVADMLLLC